MKAEMPGNAVASAAAFQRQCMRIAEQLMRVEFTLGQLFEDDVHIVGMSVRLPETEGADYLVTVRAWVGGKRVVGFHGHSVFSEALRGVWARLENRSMRWSEDKFYDNGE